MDEIETDCSWVILKKVIPTFSKFIANRLDNGRFQIQRGIVPLEWERGWRVFMVMSIQSCPFEQTLVCANSLN